MGQQSTLVSSTYFASSRSEVLAFEQILQEYISRAVANIERPESMNFVNSDVSLKTHDGLCVYAVLPCSLMFT